MLRLRSATNEKKSLRLIFVAYALAPPWLLSEVEAWEGAGGGEVQYFWALNAEPNMADAFLHYKRMVLIKQKTNLHENRQTPSTICTI